MQKETWQGCYNDGWGDLLTPESFSHPAKAARGLIYRIVKEGLRRGWFQKDTLIIDCFGGVGTTGIACAANGISCLSVELEARFVEMAEGNYRLHEAEWRSLRLPQPRIVQGDSRELGRIVREAVGGAVTSPPFTDSLQNSKERSGLTFGNARYGHKDARTDQITHEYGDSPGQLGKMPIGSITSPPYESSDIARDGRPGGGTGAHGEESRRNQRATGYGNDAGQLGAISSPPYANRVDDSGTGPVAEKNGKYGETEGQVGNLRMASVTSPPFTEAQSGGGINKAGYKDGDMVGDRTYSKDTAALSPENIASLAIGSVTSPPWEKQEAALASRKFKDATAVPSNTTGHGSTVEARQRQLERDNRQEYGSSEGQIGTTEGETYWSACALIYQQLYDLLPPGGHAAIIVKSFVRDKQIVDLPAMTLALMESQGWEPVLWVDASLVAVGEQPGLMEGVSTKRRERKSFFRRLAEKKGSPRIDAEVVLVVRKVVIDR